MNFSSPQTTTYVQGDIDPTIDESNQSVSFTSSLRNTYGAYFPDPDVHASDGAAVDTQEAESIEYDNQLDVPVRVVVFCSPTAEYNLDDRPILERPSSREACVLSPGESRKYPAGAWKYSLVRVTPQSAPSTGDVTVTYTYQ
jgi:hypothetical protein